MTVHVFTCSTRSHRFGLTEDLAGVNLPANVCINGQWKFHETITIELNSPQLFSGISPTDIINNIERNGYYIVDINIDFSERIVRS